MLARRLAILGALLALLLPRTLHAQAPPPKPVKFEWDAAKKNLYVADLSFREVIDATILRKLSRGLPTTIVFTATLFRPGITEAVSTTVQTCKVTFQVWDEVYIIERTRPDRTDVQIRLVPEGVLRHCADVRSLFAGTSSEVPVGAPLYLQAIVQVNPVSPEVLDKIKRWVSRPSGTSTASPGDALFSTFTGLFLHRIGEAERVLKFTTKIVRPRVRKPRPAR